MDKLHVRQYVPTSNHAVWFDGKVICDTDFIEVAQLVERHAPRLKSLTKVQATRAEHVDYLNNKDEASVSPEVDVVE